jgi:uncharacterized protein
MNIFSCQNCGDCCGVIPITTKELAKIKRKLRNTDITELIRLKNQNREELQCPLLDIDKMRCSVYEVRPVICHMFGFYEGMTCPNNKKSAMESREKGTKRINESMENDEIAGILGISISWEEGLLPKNFI